MGRFGNLPNHPNLPKDLDDWEDLDPKDLDDWEDLDPRGNFLLFPLPILMILLLLLALLALLH